MSKNRMALECLKGAVVSGFIYGAVGIVFLPAGAALSPFVAASAINGCLKEVVKNHYCQSDGCKLVADISFGSVGYVARAYALSTATAPFKFFSAAFIERDLTGGINGFWYGHMAQMQRASLVEDNNAPSLNTFSTVEIDIYDVFIPVAGEALDGAVSTSLKLFMGLSPAKSSPGGVKDAYVSGVGEGIKVGSLIFVCATLVGLATNMMSGTGNHTDVVVENLNKDLGISESMPLEKMAGEVVVEVNDEL